MSIESSCLSKQQYKTFKSALIGAKKIGASTSVYHCEFCKHFHHGHPTGHQLKAKFNGTRRRKSDKGY